MGEQSTLWLFEGDSSEAVASLEEIVGALDNLQSSVSDAAAGAGDLDALAEASANVAGAGGDLDAVFSGFAETLSALMDNLAAASTALGALAENATQASAGVDALGSSSDGAAGSVDALAGSADTASASLDTLGSSAEGAAAKQDAASASSKGLGEQFKGLQMPLLLAGAAVVGVGVAATVMAGNFQDSMTQLVTGAGESRSNLQMVSNGILAMATQTGESTKQLAAGLYMIESAGYHGSAALTILKDAAEGAKVGASDLGTVADATTTILNDFGSKGVTAADAVNALIATVANGKTHMQDLAQSLSQILPTASAAGVGLNDVMGALATMTGEGVPAANAATYLRQTILALDAPSAAATKALKSVGLTTQQVSAEMQRSLPDALKMITDAVGKKFPVGSAAYVAALKDISGGSKTMQGMLDLTGSHLQTFQSNVSSVAGAVHKGGNAIAGWALVSQDFNTKMSQLGATLEVVMIKVGQAIMPVATAIAAHVLPALTAFSSWATTHGPQIVQIIELAAGVIGGMLVAAVLAAAGAFVVANAAAIGIVAGIGVLVAGVLLLIQHWQQIVSFFQSSTGPAIAVKAVIAGLGAALLVFAATQVPALIAALMASVPAWIAQTVAAGAAAIAVLAAAWPFIAVGAAIALLVAGILLLVSHWSQVSKFFENLGHAILGFLSGVWNAITATVAGWGHSIQAGITWIQHAVQAGFQQVVNLIEAPIKAIVAIFAWLFNHNYYFHDLVVGIQREMQLARTIILAVWNGVKAFLSAAWGFIKAGAEGDWLLIERFIVQPVQRAVSTVESAIHSAQATLSAAWATITSDTQSAWNKFISIIQAAVGLASSAVNNVTHAILSPIQNLGGMLFSAGQHLIQMLINGIESMAGAVGNAASGIAHNISSMLGFHSPTEKGPGATADQWMPALGAMLERDLLAQAGRVGAAARHVAAAIAGGVTGVTGGSVGAPGMGGAGASGLGGALGGGLALPSGGLTGGLSTGVGGGAQIALMQRMVALLEGQQGNRAPLLGSAPVGAGLGSVTQNFGGGINLHGVTDINTLFQQLTQLAGLAQEYGMRGATVGLGI